jgi:hypothetical protein
MAQYEAFLKGDFDELLSRIDAGILSGSVSAKCEDFSSYQKENFRCMVRVYERYSMIGGNRLSLNMTLIGHGTDLFVTAITAGGSEAIFFKSNTFGEKSFLQQFISIVEYNQAGYLE